MVGVGSGYEGQGVAPEGSHPSYGAAQSLGGQRRALSSTAWFSLYAQAAAWLREKNLVALEEGWQDPASLQAQVQKQQKLQAELDTSVHLRQRLQMVRPWGSGWGPATVLPAPECGATSQSPGSQL